MMMNDMKKMKKMRERGDEEGFYKIRFLGNGKNVRFWHLTSFQFLIVLIFNHYDLILIF